MKINSRPEELHLIDERDAFIDLLVSENDRLICERQTLTAKLNVANEVIEILIRENIRFSEMLMLASLKS